MVSRVVVKSRLLCLRVPTFTDQNSESPIVTLEDENWTPVTTESLVSSLVPDEKSPTPETGGGTSRTSYLHRDSIDLQLLFSRRFTRPVAEPLGFLYQGRLRQPRITKDLGKIPVHVISRPSRCGDGVVGTLRLEPYLFHSESF